MRYHPRRPRTPFILRRNKMGRPIKREFFDPLPRTASGEVLIGGEGVASITLSNIGSGYFVANAAITVSAPNLPTGVQATVNGITLFGNGAINTFTINNRGTGYTTTPTVTITGANTYPAIDGVTLTSTVTNVIAASAYIPVANGGASAKIADIKAQKGSRRYKVITADGTGVCSLVAAAPATGQMTVIATDSQGSTYYVTKITEKRATLTQKTGSTFDYVTGTKGKWTLTGSAVAPTATDIGTVVITSN